MNTLSLPDPIRILAEDRTYTEDAVGLSGARILLFEDRVLKIMPRDPENRKTAEVMEWLKGRLPVPEVMAFETRDDLDYLFMTRLSGRMASDPVCLQTGDRLTERLAEVLLRIWETDLSGCPRNFGLDEDLAAAETQVERGLVDIDRAEPDTFGPGAFRDPEALLFWLKENRPEEDFVLSHGGFCLPNILFEGDTLSGLIDLGGCGKADRWKDAALCLRSLRHNLDGTYGGPVYPPPDETRFMDVLGVRPDPEKIRYYTLLDELF